jgi:hypothetical protein
MPAHPSCFLKRQVYDNYGYYRIDYQLASDYELLLRLIKIHNISYSYLPNVLVRMRTGGASNKNLACRWISNQEVLRACTEHGIQTNFFQLLARYPAKIWEKILIDQKKQNTLVAKKTGVILGASGKYPLVSNASKSQEIS